MLAIVSAFGLLLSTVDTRDGVAARERLAKEAIKEFYACLLDETPASNCADILEGSEAALRGIPPTVRASLAGSTPAAKHWAYLRTQRRALEPVGGGKHIRFVTSSLAGHSNLDVLPVEVVASARETAQSTGVVKIIGFGLTWSPQRGRYLVSPGSVNGVFLTHPDPRPWPPRDLSWLLGFEEERTRR
jgi:hypothetical protein